MSKVREIEEIAADWIAKRDSSEWSEPDADALARWLAADTGHRVAFVRLEAAWKQANRLKALGAGVPPGVIPEPSSWRASPFFERAERKAAPVGQPHEAMSDVTVRRRSKSFLAVASAATVLLAVVVFAWRGDLSGRTSYSTMVGAVSSVPIADGSTVTLNTNSLIRVAVSESERRIDLNRGEAFFDVAKDPTRPFVVVAGNRRVVAVGTKFSVRRDEAGTGEIRVIVTEGRVRIEPIKGDAEAIPAELTAGAIARGSGESVLIQKRPLDEIEETLSWRNGYLVFRDTPLADAVMEFNRYNNRRVVIDDPDLAQIPIGGNFRATNLDAFVRLLEEGFGVSADIRGEEIILH